MRISSICLYCGASNAAPDRYKALARRFGRMLAERGLSLIYGGGGVGLMNAAAEGALEAGGHVVGIIPDFLDKIEIGNRAIAELHVVTSMHARKQLMFERADAFVILPGGFGTLDELMEVLTWKILRQHDKPIVIVDFEGYWRPLRELIDHIIAERFAGPAVREMIRFVPTVEAALAALAAAPEPELAPADAARL